MPRKKKKRKDGEKTLMKKKEGVFNPALQGQDILPMESPYDSTGPDLESPPADFLHLEEDEKVFLEAMEGVAPLASDHERVTPLPKVDVRPAHPAPDDELEAMTHLSELVSG